MPIEGPIATAYLISFISLALSWLAFFVAVLLRLHNSGTGLLWLTTRAAGPQGVDFVTKAVLEHFSTRLGRIHGFVLVFLIVTSIALGLCTAVENKRRTQGEAKTITSVSETWS